MLPNANPETRKQIKEFGRSGRSYVTFNERVTTNQSISSSMGTGMK